MAVLMDDLAVAFAMRCDTQGLTYEQGVEAARELADDLEFAAEERKFNPAVTKEEADD